MFLDISLGGAALGGLLSFLSPCVLPLVPFYFCYMAGISMAELREDGIAPGAQRRLFVLAIFFAIGVTTIFVFLGMAATAIGQAFGDWIRPLSYVAALILFLFGLHFLGVLKIPLLYRQMTFETRRQPSTIVGSYVTGLAFGFGWTPCVGPALAAVLMVASTQDSVSRGALLLLVYGLGMTLPFVIGALFCRPFLNWMQRKRKYLGHIEKAMGVFLIIFAVLIATNTVTRISQFLIDYFPGLTAIG